MCVKGDKIKWYLIFIMHLIGAKYYSKHFTTNWKLDSYHSSQHIAGAQ